MNPKSLIAALLLAGAALAVLPQVSATETCSTTAYHPTTGEYLIRSCSGEPGAGIYSTDCDPYLYDVFGDPLVWRCQGRITQGSSSWSAGTYYYVDGQPSTTYVGYIATCMGGSGWTPNGADNRWCQYGARVYSVEATVFLENGSTSYPGVCYNSNSAWRCVHTYPLGY